MANKYQERMKAVVEKFGTWYEDKKLLDDGVMTSTRYPYTAIFSPLQVNGVKIKNRLVMGPMGNISMAEETGRPNTKMIQYFTERAKGGVGLITSGLVPISHGIDPTVTEKGGLSYFPRIDASRTRFAGWRDIAERCHGYGAKFFIQLTPGLGRVGSPECLVNKFKLPVSASWNPNFYLPAIPCRPLSGRMAWKIIKNAGQASSDAKALLIDGVYLHGHEGYLLEQMTNTAFNRRTFGAFADWQRFGIELIKEIRRRVGKAYPIMYRIDLSLALNETYGEKMNTVKTLRKFKNERTVEQTLEYMANLVRAGVDIFDVDLGCYDNWWLPHPPGFMPPGCYLEMSRIVKEYFEEHRIRTNAGMDVPVVAVGKLGYPDLAEQALRDKQCDMVMLARPLLADPQWPNKAYAGRVEKICPCIGDQEGCINEFVDGGHPQCTVNPRTGHEDIYDGSELSASGKIKSIAVVGGGPAGANAAMIAAHRGHKVTLFEKREEIGGMLIPGSRPAIKFDIHNYRAYGREVDVDFLRAGRYDAVICATGTVQKRPPAKNIDAPHVVLAVDLLRDPSMIDAAKNIVIVGGGSVGCETAYFLVHEKKKNVKIVEMLPEIMKGVCTSNRGFLIHYLEKIGVELLNCSMLKEVGDRDVLVEQNISKTVPDPYNTWTPIVPENIENPFAGKIKDEFQARTLKADLVVLSAGARPADELYYACQAANVAPELYNIGDSFACGRLLEAARAAYQVATVI
jgi:2-enoate reductase